MKFLITGDTHGNFTRFENFNPGTEPVAVIILGDAGFNFYLNKTDWKNKRHTAGFNIVFYCVRGNHEERPQNIPSMELMWDDAVKGYVYMELEFPHIRYFCDGGEYLINGRRTLVIGGAYSIDKWYRLSGRLEDTEHWTGWFKDEQLTIREKERIDFITLGEHYDLVLSHTCPLSWEPRDLFLNFVDQSQVDKSMEQWLDSLKEHIKWDIWLFGHYHADRIERPFVEMYFHDIEELDAVFNRWDNYTGELPNWFEKSPNFDKGV